MKSLVKKTFAVGLASIMSVSSVCVMSVLADDDPKMINVIAGGDYPVRVSIIDENHYDGSSYETLVFQKDSQPFIDENGRTQIPLRAVGEELGFNVGWDSATKKITLVKAERSIVFYLNSNIFNINGESVKMDTTPQLVNDRTFIPLRYIGEAVGYTVEYTDRTQMPTIESANAGI